MSLAKIAIDEKIASAVSQTGNSFNQVLEETYMEELQSIRNSSKHFENKSATKIALIQAGVRGNQPLNSLFTTSTNEFLYPALMADLLDTTMMQSDYMPYIVSGEMSIAETVIKVPTLDLLDEKNKDAAKRKRIAEGAEFSFAEITIGSETVEIHKKGAALMQTYEAARNMRIDLFSRLMSAIANDITKQNVDSVSSVIYKGATDKGATATANTITNDELIDLALDYLSAYGYAPNTIIAPDSFYKSIYKMLYGTNEAFGVSQRIGLSFPGMNLEDIAIIPGNVPKSGNKDTMVMYNRDYSVQRVVQNDSVLTEYDRNILKQTNFVTMSEVSGYAQFIKSAFKVTSA